MYEVKKCHINSKTSRNFQCFLVFIANIILIIWYLLLVYLKTLNVVHQYTYNTVI